MPNNRLGELRRSAAVMTFGPGSVVDFRVEGAPVSAVAAGIEEWDRNFPPAGLANPQRISEPRLQRRLSVTGFRLPPVTYEGYGATEQPNHPTLAAVRFPSWLQCPQCNRLALARRWQNDPGQAYRYCAACTAQAPGQTRAFAIPIRFVMACPKGHLDEFPWHLWVAHKADCKKKDSADLYLRSERPGLEGLILYCQECKIRRSMEGVFSSRVFQHMKCRGRRPWLAAADEDSCDATPRVLQRGASNLYFPVIESALSVPPWSDVLQEALGIYWNPIINTSPKQRAAFIAVLAEGELAPVLEELKLTPNELARQVEDRLTRYNDDAILNIRQEEYRQFTLAADVPGRLDREFEVRTVPVPPNLQRFFSRIVRAVRLREVRALKGFTRINPPGDEDSAYIAEISASKLDWLPAIEVRGEGIFLDFNKDTLHEWEMQQRIVSRAQQTDARWQGEWKSRYGDGVPDRSITPRYLLVHTFAHALMRQLTLECGYSTSALRERLYVGEGSANMAGLLIYTATSDSDGTLGGLQRQGEIPRLEHAVMAAIKAMQWCSSDPLCIKGMISGTSGLSLAACHACVLAPETACEDYNHFLDRTTLVGLPDGSAAGFFSTLLRDT